MRCLFYFLTDPPRGKPERTAILCRCSELPSAVMSQDTGAPSVTSMGCGVGFFLSFFYFLSRKMVIVIIIPTL